MLKANATHTELPKHILCLKQLSQSPIHFPVNVLLLTTEGKSAENEQLN